MTLFYRLGAFAARHRIALIGAWAALVLVTLPVAPRVSSTLQSGGFSVESLEASQTRIVLEQELGLAPSALVIVIESEMDAGAGDPAFESAVATALETVPQADHVIDVLSHTVSPRQISSDGRTVFEIVALDLPPDSSPDGVAAIEAAIQPAPGIRTHLAGGPAFYGDVQRVSEHDLQRSELISLPLAAVALVAVFGSLVAAGLPILSGGAGVVVALGAIFLLASATPMSIFVLNLATLLGFGLGIDYALLLTSRFREELGARGGGRRPDGSTDQSVVNEAVAVSVATAGRAVFFSGLTVLLGLSGLVLFEFMVLRSVGIAGAIVVGIAVASALTLLPASLAIVGPRIDRLSPQERFRSWRRRRAATAASQPEQTAQGANPSDETTPRSTSSSPAEEHAGAWARLAYWVMDRPLRVFVPTLLFLILLGSPFIHVRLNAPDASILPPNVPSRQGYDVLLREFGEGEFSPLLLAVRTTGPATDPETVGDLYDYARRIGADPRVSRIESIVDVDPRLTKEQYQLLYSDARGTGDPGLTELLRRTTAGDLTTFTVVTRYGPNRPEAHSLVDDLRDPASALRPPAGITVQVGGGAADVMDVVERVVADFPASMLVILVTTYLVLFVLLRSVVLPAKALVMNALSILASFGALVWIFQDGNLSALLGFQPLGFVETTMPVILFCVLFGLSMDYEVFLLTRMKEVHDRTGDNREAVAKGLERSGRIVTSAALIVVVVAGSFAFADIVLIKALGLGTAIAVAIDATIVRALLVPSTMRLLGEANWWLPKRLDRWIATRLPHIEGGMLGGLPFQMVALALVGLLILGACSPSGRILANDPAIRPEPPTPTPSPVRPVDPQPIALPRDDAPHARLTEWWYYTGHLEATDGRRFGYEFVIFRAERGSLPVGWASHAALTDEAGDRFVYRERVQLGSSVDLGSAALQPGAEPAGFDLAILGGGLFDPSPDGAASVPPSPEASGPPEPWRMQGRSGLDRLDVTTDAFELSLSLDADGRPPVLHDHDGYVSFGPAGGSYYYSRTRMATQGTLTYGGEQLAVEGSSWFDHQWGDFISVGAGGWDWFAIGLEDGTDLHLSLVRDREGGLPIAYGTLVRPDGGFEHLDRSAFSIEVTDHWTSPASGATYPAGWTITLPDEELRIELSPTVADQELDTRASTGVVYWEGSQTVEAARAGIPIDGRAYVELTGYAPGLIVGASPSP